MSNIIYEKETLGNEKKAPENKVSKVRDYGKDLCKSLYGEEKRLASVDSLKKLMEIQSTVIAKDRKIQSANTILVQDYDKNGEPYFSVAEILDAKKGIYIILSTGKIVFAEPFVGQSNVDMKITYYQEHGGEPETHERKATYAHLPRKDRIVYSKLYHFYSSEVKRIYGIQENFRHETDNDKFYSSLNLEIEGWGFLKKPFVANYIDKMGILESKTASVDKWLTFERDFNSIFRHYLHTGKNYLKEDEAKVVKELNAQQAEVDAMVARSKRFFAEGLNK